jgi:integrase
LRAIGIGCDINSLNALKLAVDACLQSDFMLRLCCDEEKAMSGSGKVRGRMQLTVKAIEAFKPEAEPYRMPDMRAVGLALRVAPSGLKTWDLAYRVKGSAKVKRLSLGRYGDPGAGLEEARARAAALTGAARQGLDLIAQEFEAREAKARSVTVGKLIEVYLARRVVGRLRSAPNVTRILQRVLEPLAGMHAADVRRRDLAPLLEVIAARGHERSAGKTRTLIGGMFKWAETQDYIGVDPTRGLAAYDQGRPRDRVLDAYEIRALWPWLETLPLAIADALRFQLLTGCRIGEVAGMPGVEIDLDKWVWVLPAERAKNKRPRTTPLVGLARQIIAARIDVAGDGPLFSSETGGVLTSAAVGTALLSRRRRLPIAVFRSHDLRRTAASLMYEFGISRDTISAIVGHADEGERGSRALIRHYLKSDLIERKRRALEAWDARLHAIISGAPVDNIVQLARG